MMISRQGAHVGQETDQGRREQQPQLDYTHESDVAQLFFDVCLTAPTRRRGMFFVAAQHVAPNRPLKNPDHSKKL